MPNRVGPAIALVLLAIIGLSIVTHLDREQTDKGSVSGSMSYKPAFLPIKFSLGPEGVEVSGDGKVVTPIGEFSIGAKMPLTDPNFVLRVIIRDQHKGKDDVYDVRMNGDKLAVRTNGSTLIEISRGQVVIDVTDGTVQTIDVTSTGPAKAGGGNAIAGWWSHGWDKWDAGYATSPYRPFTLSRWMYDDSTIGRWYGIGFVWFLLRLLLALVLGVVDLLLTVVFLVAQLAFWFFGATGRNIVWGIVVLPLCAVLVAAAWNNRHRLRYGGLRRL